MNKTERYIVILLIVSIIFSVLSIMINFIGSEIELPSISKQAKIVRGGGATGNVALTIEVNPEPMEVNNERETS